MTHATCEHCHQEMAPGNGCKFGRVKMKKVYQRIKFGDEKRYGPGPWDDDGVCGDCNVKKGQYHHLGCDIEECPVCGGQLISCGC